MPIIPERKPFRVELNVIKRVAYVVDARSAEEAEVQAESYLADNEEPTDSEILEVLVEETYPVEE